ncbi:MAG: hypothetical protein KJ060_07235, partial [Candidatus Hydrogenedentes bacterium]|nr:hypothetical protein [Candidatus Hydrogenedentota bacterium]
MSFQPLRGVLGFLFAALIAQGQEAFTEPGGTLTLEQAIHAALQGSPKLAAFDWDLRAADARVLQASLRPNPDLEFEIEDIRLNSGPGATSRTRT